jgi:hypothetical protein
LSSDSPDQGVLSPPDIVEHDRQAIVDRVVAWVEDYQEGGAKAGWKRPIDPHGMDAGLALIELFGDLAEIVRARINRLPQRNFLSYLYLIGVRQQPPKSARVPVTFAAVKKAPDVVVVPAGTQVSAAPPPGESEAVVFETERTLTIGRAELQSIITLDGDKQRDYGVLLGKNPPAGWIQAFSGTDPSWSGAPAAQPVVLQSFLAVDELLRIDGPKMLTITISWAAKVQGDPQALTKLLKWSYWNGKAWSNPITPDPIKSTSTPDAMTVALALDANPKATVHPVVIDGVEACWLRATVALAELLPLPEVKQIAVFVNFDHDNLRPSKAFVNSTAVDLGKAYLPLGAQPSYNDTLCLAFDPALSKANADVTITVTMANANGDSSSTPKQVYKSGNPQVEWTLWNGTTWNKLDATCTFLGDATLKFTNLAQPVSTTISGEVGWWLRARMVAGDYGKTGQYKPTVIASGDLKGITVYEPIPDTLSPPLVESIVAKYGIRVDANPSSVRWLVYDGLTTATWDGSQAHPLFSWFVSSRDDSILFLGFDRPLGNQTVSIFAQLADTDVDAFEVQPIPNPIYDEQPTDEPRLQLDYAEAGKFTPIPLFDESQAFARSGILSFIGPPRQSPAILLSEPRQGAQPLYWLGLRRRGADNLPAAKLSAFLPNTTWARQSQSFTNEILGSSNGEPNQSFALLHTPVSTDELIEVLEAASNSWVAWQAQVDLQTSGSSDRHYSIERMTGAVVFGDGKRGAIPPLGSNNIRASYRSGGGRRGNCAAGKVKQMLTSIPYVMSASNPVAGDGGTDLETVEHLARRGPLGLRHRGRAVTAIDIGDLAAEASNAVARVQVLSPTFNDEDFIGLGQTRSVDDLLQNKLRGKPGLVRILIVPEADEAVPRLTEALRNEVLTYVRGRADAAVRLWVGGPIWSAVSVTATLIPINVDRAEDARAEARQRLDAFLHPLHGGLDGQGWEFGRFPHESDIYRVLNDIDIVQRVQGLSLAFSEQPAPMSDQVGMYLIHSGDHQLDTASPTGGA